MAGIWLFHILGKRYIGVFIDPVISCNFRCRMCYFSDEEYRKNNHGMMKMEDIRLVARAFFHRALKLQIGCGAEPTLYRNLVDVVKLGRQYRVPYISLTTNGNLLDRTLLSDLVDAGLDEITLSAHGMTKEKYEYFMTNGNFDLFLRLLGDIQDIKKEKPSFKLRINYTINQDNIEDLAYFWDVVKCADIIQLRPMQDIGSSVYGNTSTQYIIERYDDILLPIREECSRRGIICIMPDKENLENLKSNDFVDNSVEEATYCYVSSKQCWKDDFDYHTDTFESYSKRTNYTWKLFRQIFRSKKVNVDVTRKMNYKVK